MAAYLIANVDVKNPEGYQQYVEEADPTVKQYGGKYLVGGGRVEVLEGRWQAHRLVIIEFESIARAREWYECAEYQSARRIRQRNATSKILLVEGLYLH